jgi:hypothetical protein
MLKRRFPASWRSLHCFPTAPLNAPAPARHIFGGKPTSTRLGTTAGKLLCAAGYIGAVTRIVRAPDGTFNGLGQIGSQACGGVAGYRESRPYERMFSAWSFSARSSPRDNHIFAYGLTNKLLPKARFWTH